MSNFKVLFLSVIMITTGQAAELNLSPVPLYLGGSLEPNIMFTMDDSGSMHWEHMPGTNMGFSTYMFPRTNGVYGSTDYANQVPNFDDDNVHNFFGRSTNNAVFYNPDVSYIPWSNSDGSSMAPATPTSALYNPGIPALGGFDLTSQQTQNACWFTHTTSLTNAAGAPCFGDYTYWPITYFRYNGGTITTRANYTLTEITTATPAAATFTSPNGTTRTRDEEIQNFANWFQYYRSRALMAKAGVGRAFAKQGTNLRVGYATINKGNSSVDNVNTDSVVTGVRPFSGAGRQEFFDQLYGRPLPQSGTPLRTALQDVGEYFERTDDRGPWSETPGTQNTVSHLQCRQSYNVLMTDGFWNGADPSAINNSDNTNGLLITGPNDPNFQYTPAPPFSDAWSDTLADTAMHYWKRDLRTDLSNKVPTNAQDPAFWQHLVNFTVGLGVNGTLDPIIDWPDLQDATTAWPQPNTDPAKIDDLWHAGVNSRGNFFSAADPDTFADSLSDILSNIADRTSSASSIALNSGTLSVNSKIYQARFDSGDWTGQLLAFPIDATGTIGAEEWDAANLIPAAGDRVIITHDGSNGQPFRWASLSGAQQGLLGSQAVVDYLRGDQSNETSNVGGTFRNRTSLLGDIVHSSPTYVGPPSLNYPNGLGTNVAAKNYSSFKTDNSARQPMVYVGSNDGMMHGFNADTGVEVFAYTPNAIMNKLADLSDVNYNHKYYVDESPVIVDAFFGSPAAWHSVLVSGLRAGGQAIFALDITDPTDFASEATAKTKVLWEFTDNDNNDLGFTFGTPSVVRLQNGTWAAVFSGGYNNTADDDGDSTTANDSTDGNAYLYIVDISDGSLIKKFDTKTGTAEDPSGNGRPNGLSPPSIVDIDSDFTADYIYAGDLFGNVWKFDISGSGSGSWGFAYGNAANPEPIYTACSAAACNASNTQAITTQLQVVRHPTKGGFIILFGTGQYIEVGDNSTVGQTTQSFYGIWDKAESSLTAFDRGDLLQQEITNEVTDSTFDLRVTTQNTIDWASHNGWYLDLVNTESGNTNNFGERQVSNSIVRNDRIIFTTLLPSDDPCDFGGTGWLMLLDVFTGARLEFSPFDINDDGFFTSTDYVNVGDIDGDGSDDFVPVSGKKSKVGIISTPSIAISSDGSTEYLINSGSTGDTEVSSGNPGPSSSGRQSWRQLDY